MNTIIADNGSTTIAVPGIVCHARKLGKFSIPPIIAA